MKRKLFLSLIVLLTIVMVTGCTNTKSSKKNSKNKGEIYNMVSLNDTVSTGVKVFEGIVPKGWNSYIESNWNVINSMFPGKEKVKLSSPDGLASITIISQESFIENKKYAEGENKEYYSTYLHYMDAPTYLDYYINNNYQGAEFKKDMDVEEDLLNQLKEYNSMMLKQGQEDATKVSNNSVAVTVSGYGVTSSKKQYEVGSNYLEASTSVSALKTNLDSSILPSLSSESITWTMPYTIVYQAEDKKAFDKYYDDYKFIIANSHFTVDYYAMVEYVSSAITNAYTSYYAAKAKASLDATNAYIDSNYSSTSSESTNEKVMGMWDDYINEVDAYTTEDGSTIKTSMYNETVAQNGDEIYIGSKAGIPNGFNELSKAY